MSPTLKIPSKGNLCAESRAGVKKFGVLMEVFGGILDRLNIHIRLENSQVL
jgi:hypothetical protein